jgi:hypothetical protein
MFILINSYSNSCLSYQHFQVTTSKTQQVTKNASAVHFESYRETHSPTVHSLLTEETVPHSFFTEIFTINPDRLTVIPKTKPTTSIIQTTQVVNLDELVTNEISHSDFYEAAATTVPVKISRPQTTTNILINSRKIIIGPYDQSLLPIWNNVDGNHLVFTEFPINILSSSFKSFGVRSYFRFTYNTFNIWLRNFNF